MSKITKILAYVIIFFISFSTNYVSLADSPTDQIPAGFRLIESSVGVQLYRKDYIQGNPDFVQVIDLTQGAGIELLHGDIGKPGIS